MNLVPVSLESIRIGLPLPFPLVDRTGVLLARKSFVIQSKDDLIDISNRGGGLYIDVADSNALHRAYLDQLQTLVRDEKSLGEIADSKLVTDLGRKRVVADGEGIDWLDLQDQANHLLHDTQQATFLQRLELIRATLDRAVHRNPDGALFALIHLTATETRMYSATHGLLVSIMCTLAAQEVLNWPEPNQSALMKAALIMNIGMTDLQNRLAIQPEPPSVAQQAVIDTHPQRSVAILQSLGIADETLLEAVREHHTRIHGDLQTRTLPMRMARLIQRADMFAAQLAPRSSRAPVSPAAAMQSCYFGEDRQVDEAGAALIKTVGIYQPGTFVRLATEEVAVVIRRGSNTTTPRVAVLVNRSGVPTVEPIQRDTTVKEYRVVASVAHRDMKVKISLEKLLPLTIAPSPNRPW
jgi:HD-GYP domain-containing protein (c-di-GMP phosphodiesterase class II)